MANYFVERLIARGPGRTDSVIEFVSGLNIIHASSESGKTMAANSIAYAFGCSKVPFLPDTTDGYDSVEIQLRSQDGFLTKITRHINEDSVHVASDNPDIKEDTYSLEYPKDDDTPGKTKKDTPVLNTLLLKLIGLDCVPLIGANNRSDKKRLTWKNFFQVLYLDKEKIGLDEHVIEPKETYERTLLLSCILFIIYGRDYSEKEPQMKSEIRKAQTEAQLGYVENKIDHLMKLIRNADIKLEKLAGPDAEENMKSFMSSLDQTEKEIHQISKKSKTVYEESVKCSRELTECEVLQNRYQNLHDQYIADIQRLSNIVEGENALFQLPDAEKCPYCENPLSSKHQESNLVAAKAELARTVSLLKGLMSAEGDLGTRQKKLEKTIEKLDAQRKDLEDVLKKRLIPQSISLKKIIEANEERTIAEQNKKALEEMLEDLKNDITRIKDEDALSKAAKGKLYKPREYFTDDLIKSMTVYAKDILKACNYEKYNTTTFDLKSFDVKVDGIPKSMKHGQGYCSFLNSVLYLMFRKCFYEKAKYKPGFLMIDTPLLGLEQRIGNNDPDSIKTSLYRYLLDHKNEGQVIILENTDKIPSFLYEGQNVSVIEFPQGEREGFLVDFKPNKSGEENHDIQL